MCFNAPRIFQVRVKARYASVDEYEYTSGNSEPNIVIRDYWDVSFKSVSFIFVFYFSTCFVYIKGMSWARKRVYFAFALQAKMDREVRHIRSFQRLHDYGQKLYSDALIVAKSLGNIHKTPAYDSFDYEIEDVCAEAGQKMKILSPPFFRQSPFHGKCREGFGFALKNCDTFTPEFPSAA